ncbi:MAG: Gfo/Idh/MocA family oxidoreductase [Planctomycetes bacterium]|nr:Gfo/Idh/MocA family oxidoreductase [Planctomycetota bacterium]
MMRNRPSAYPEARVGPASSRSDWRVLGWAHSNPAALVVGVLMLATVSHAQTRPAGPAKVYGVGVVGNCCTHGAGLVAKFKNDPRTRVVAAFEANARRAAELQVALGGPLAASYDDVIRNPAVDIVAVSCDPADKATMVEKAAASGKHVFLNKPFGDSLDNARRIAAAVERHRVKFVHDIPMVRGVPVFARLLDEVRAGTHGRVVGYHHLFGMNFPLDFDLKGRWPERLDPPAKSGGGELTNMGCYAIDYAVALFGRPQRVIARWQKNWDVYEQTGVENYGQIVLDYGYFLAFLQAGKQQLAADRRGVANAVTISFEHEMLMIDAAARLATVNQVPQDFAAFEAGAVARGSLDQLIDAIETDREPSGNAASGVMATEVLMAAYQSIQDDGRPVDLPLASGANPLVARPARPPATSKVGG